MKLPKVIVGVDPGTTAGVAVLSLRGKLLALESRKNFGRNEIIRYVSSVGTPTMVATDKALPPSLVLKISSNFNSLTFSPRYDLKHNEKKDITNGYETKDSHQRDALAAALFAYTEHEETLKKVERSVEGLGLWKYSDDIKDMIIKGRCRNVAEAIETVLSVEKRPGKRINDKRKKATKGDMESIINKLRGSLKEKERSMNLLENYAGKLEERVSLLEKENEKMGKKKPRKKVPENMTYKIRNLNNKIKDKDRKVGELKENLRLMKKIEETIKRGYAPVKVAEETNLESLEKLEKKLGLYKDIVYFKKYSKPDKRFAKRLKEKETEVILGDFPEEIKKKIEKEGILVLEKNEVDVKILKGFGHISPESLKKVRKKGLINWLKEYRKR